MLSDPAVIRQLAADVSSSSSSSSFEASATAHDGKTFCLRLIVLRHHGQVKWRKPFCFLFFSVLLHAGASPLSEMPSAGEVAALGLATTGTGEDPLFSTTKSTLGTRTIDASSTRSRTAKLPASDTITVGSSTSGQGFSLGHGFLLIPGKIVS